MLSNSDRRQAHKLNARLSAAPRDNKGKCLSASDRGDAILGMLRLMLDLKPSRR